MHVINNKTGSSCSQNPQMRIHQHKKNFTTIDNDIFRNKALSLKAKGLLCTMLSLPEDWNYTVRGLASIVKESQNCIASTIQELEAAGYIVRSRVRAADGTLGAMIYDVYEKPIDKGLDVVNNTPSQPEPSISEECTVEAEHEANQKDSVIADENSETFNELCSKSLKAVNTQSIDKTYAAYKKALEWGYTPEQVLKAYEKYINRYRATNFTLKYAKQLERWLLDGDGLRWDAGKPAQKSYSTPKVTQSDLKPPSDDALRALLKEKDETYAALCKEVSLLATKRIKALLVKSDDDFTAEWEAANAKLEHYFTEHRKDVMVKR